ncbi:MAG: nuclear transport factor 2 family protein [Pseudomonadota bacterium]
MASFSPATAGQDAIAEIRRAIDALDGAFEKEDNAAIQALLTPEHRAVAKMYAGAADIQRQFQLFPEVSFSLYSPENQAIQLLADGVALATHEIDLKGEFRGQALPQRLYVSAIWVKREGRWLQHFYQETDIGPWPALNPP